MTPVEFAELVVVPTVKDFLSERGDRRRAYLACIVVHHLVDYVAHAEGLKKVDNVWSKMKATAGLSWEAVQGISNGTKHPQSQHARRFPPGRETEYPIFSLDTPGAGLDQALFDVEGLEVEVNSYCLFIDECVQAVFRAFVTTYPQHLGAVDRSFLDEQFRTAAPP